ncbi:hypothetical protein NDN08_005523 [Rhodosorus marinus]|uniref:BAR domain-containing protein n=1 Tax=Rhodosorus marinus TaxID=101924 RepID=A0AAV8V276_9RHOD|nr:hypothetical protein NDN08_005523 [Rhodosorus marinus]
MHGLKVVGRQMEEGIGMKGGKNSALFNQELLEKKKMIETNWKNLGALGKHFDEVLKSYATLGKRIDAARPVMEEAASPFRSDVYRDTLGALNGVGATLENIEPAEVTKARQTLKIYAKEMETSTVAEWKMYEKARIEYDMRMDQMKKNIKDQDKIDTRERKMEDAEEMYNMRKESITKKYDLLIATLPKIWEIGTLALAQTHIAMTTAFGGKGAELAKLAAENREKLLTDLTSLNLGNKSKIAAGEAKPIEE